MDMYSYVCITVHTCPNSFDFDNNDVDFFGSPLSVSQMTLTDLIRANYYIFLYVCKSNKML